MKAAIAFSVPITTAPGFGWRWRADDYKQESSEFFVFYYDCVADAQCHGYKVKPVSVHGRTAPAGAPWDLA